MTRGPRSALGPGTAVTMACFVGVMLASAALLTAMGARDTQPGLRGVLASVLLVSFSLAAVAVALARGGPGVKARLRLGAPPAVDAAVMGLGTLGLGSALDAWVFLLGLRDEGTLGMMHDLLGGLVGPAQLGAALVVGLAPGLGEELFFRGYVLRKLAFTDGAPVALVVSALLFGAFHADLVQAPAAAVVGLYLGVAVRRTGSLWVGVVAHVVNNVGATLFGAGHDGPGVPVRLPRAPLRGAPVRRGAARADAMVI